MSRAAKFITEAIWPLLLGIVLLYGFFVLLDAVNPGEAWGVTVVVLIVAVAYAVHAWARRRRMRDLRDIRLTHDRERRGF